MKINEKIKKSVAFLQYKLADGSPLYAGTCFFIQRNSDPTNKQSPYTVTAKHVIEEVRKKGLDKIFIKLNLKSGTTFSLETKISDWLLHDDKDVDISILFLPFDPDTVDQYVILESTFLDGQKTLEQEIECGDEVVITGLFKHHSGSQSNLPIVRMGNIAMMPGEKVKTKDHLMDAYLIESRSIGGLSGSPVFVNYGLHRRISGRIMQSGDSEVNHNLIGLIYGHFDIRNNQIDSIDSATDEERKINVGIAIVTPISKLVEMFKTDKFKKYEEEKIQQYSYRPQL
jgi:hypothetical protein